MSIKTNKSLTKRMKITKNGKLLVRKPGQDHFNAKEGGQKQLANKRKTRLNLKNKEIGKYLPNLVK